MRQGFEIALIWYNYKYNYIGFKYNIFKSKLIKK